MKNVVAFCTLFNDKPVCYQVTGFKCKKGDFLARVSKTEALNMGPFDEWSRKGGYLVRKDGNGAISMIEFIQLNRDEKYGYYCSDAEKAKAEDVLAQLVLRH